MRYTHSVVINRPPAEVFAYLADPTNLPRWQPSVERVQKSWNGTAAAGLHFTESRRFLGRQLESNVEIVVYEPPNNFTIKVISGPVSLTVEHLLTETRGGTEIHVTAQGKVTALPRVAGSLAVRIAKRQAEQDFNRLKLLLDGPDADASCAAPASQLR